MIPAVLYAAKSTEDKHGSIPDQLADGRRLADERGFEAVGEFQDEAASAYHGDRGGGLAAALAKCEQMAAQHGTCALIVQHSDRLARGDVKQARHLIEIVVWAIKTDVQLLSVQDPEVLAGGEMGLLMGVIGGMRNHQDSKRKGVAVRGGIRRRAVERRQFIGGRRPFGYRHRDTTEDGRGTGPLVIDEAEATVIRRVFSEYLRGVSQRQIALDLMADGVPTLTGAAWYATTVAGMLRNPLYKGWITHGSESFPAIGPDGKPTLEPIIDAGTWERAHEQREAMSRTRAGGRGRTTRGSHVLTNGLLLCACGAPMSPVTKPTRTPGQLYEVYTCAKRLHHGPSACAQPPIKRQAIDGALWRYFVDAALDLDATRQMFTEQASQQLAELDVLQQQAEVETTKVESALARIEADYIAGRIDAEKWTRLEGRLRGETDAARAQAGQHERQRQVVAASIAEFDAEAAMLEELTALRNLIAGEAEAASHGGLQSFRMALRRLFAGFELVPLGGTPRHFGTGKLDGEVWQGGAVPNLERDGTPYVLWPYVRPEAMKSIDSTEWPALQRTALDLRDNFHSFLAA